MEPFFLCEFCVGLKQCREEEEQQRGGAAQGKSAAEIRKRPGDGQGDRGAAGLTRATLI